MGCTRAAVNDEKRLAVSENLVVDHDAVGVHVTFADSVDIGGGGVGGRCHAKWRRRHQCKES